MKRLWLLSILFLAPSVSSCGCNAILNISISPSTVTLAVGETASPPQISVSGCTEPRRVVDIASWSSNNPDIALVDAATGVITGVAPGETNIIAYREKDFKSAVPFTVTVTAPATAAR